MNTSFRAVYERKSGTLRPLETVDLPEGELIVTARPANGEQPPDEDGFPIQRTLADVYGFDPNDEEKLRALAESQYRAIRESIRELYALGLRDALRHLPPSDSDLDALLYNEED
jgi:hypothetical protein